MRPLPGPERLGDILERVLAELAAELAMRAAAGPAGQRGPSPAFGDPGAPGEVVCRMSVAEA